MEKNIKAFLIATIFLQLICFSKSIYAQSSDSTVDDQGDGVYLGRYSSNPVDADSTSNPVGQYGSEVSSKSVNNPVGRYGSPVSPNSVNNPLATDTPKLYSQDGKYLGKVNSNTLDPESISNPIGRYGSPVSPDSVNNPVGRYGSSVSPESANNPLAIRTPVIVYGRGENNGGEMADDQ